MHILLYIPRTWNNRSYRRSIQKAICPGRSKDLYNVIYGNFILLYRALAKESGYTSDSNLVFRKKELPVSSPLSPVEQRQAYKSLQAGGEPPLLGFRKPAPEKPKGRRDVYSVVRQTN